MALDDDMSMLEAFRRADDVLVQAVRGISDLITQTGLINVDFADVKTIMSGQGRALMGTGFGKGERRALDAVEMAINSPLLDDISINGAMGILLNFTAGPDVRLKEINEAASLVQQAGHEDANIIFGLLTDPDMGDVVKVTAIATGFEVDSSQMVEVMAPGAPARTSRVMPISMAAPAAAARSSSVPQVPRVSHVSHAPASHDARASRRSSHPPEQVSLPAMGSRAFGAAALADEATLDIPAYLRRASIAD